MAKFYDKLTSRLQNFIKEQKIFFVATAPEEGRINLSPKGMDSLRVVDENRVLWLNVTGSGNETAAHLIGCAASRSTSVWQSKRSQLNISSRGREAPSIGRLETRSHRC